MAIERVRVLVEGFCADNTSSMAAFMSQAKSFATPSNKLLLYIKTKQVRSLTSFFFISKFLFCLV
jgi:hypothetical protein